MAGSSVYLSFCRMPVSASPDLSSSGSYAVFSCCTMLRTVYGIKMLYLRLKCLIEPLHLPVCLRMVYPSKYMVDLLAHKIPVERARSFRFPIAIICKELRALVCKYLQWLTMPIPKWIQKLIQSPY